MNHPYFNLKLLLGQNPPSSKHEDDTLRLLYDILRLRRLDTPQANAQLKIVLLRAAEAVHTGEPLHNAQALNNDFAAFTESLTLDYMANALPQGAIQ